MLQKGEIVLHRNIPCVPESLLITIAADREDIAVAVEWIFTWYWVTDLCSQQNIPFVLGHALYINATHGGKAKNDKIGAHKIAVLLRGGMMTRLSTGCARCPTSVRFRAWSSSTRSTTSSQSPWSRTLAPIRAGSSVPRSRQENRTELPVIRSATCTSNGPSPKHRSFFSERSPSVRPFALIG
jgi:hypothetical protein